MGGGYEAAQAAEVKRLCEELPPVPAGPEQALLSVDGAMVPLCGGEWAEVKTLVVGEIAPALAPLPTAAPVEAAGKRQAQTTALSYCSRLADVEQFNEAVLGELHRRGVETAGQVGAVSGGAEWIQGFVDLHCPQAVRTLDFSHPPRPAAPVAQTLPPAAPGRPCPRRN